MENINENDNIGDLLDLDLLPELPEDLQENADNQSNNEQQESNGDTEGEVETPDAIKDETDENQESDDSGEELEEGELVAIQAFYDMLKDRKLVSDKEVNSWEDVEAEIEAYKEQLPDQVKQSIMNSTSETSRKFIEYALTKPDMTEEDLKNFFEVSEEQSIEITTAEQAREYLQKKFAGQLDPDAITGMADALEDKGKLIETAQEQNNADAQKEIERAAQERQELEKQQEELSQNIIAEFEKQEWRDDHKETVKEFFFSGQLDSTFKKIISDPSSLVQLANIISYFDENTNTFNLDTFFTKANTKNVNSARKRIVSGMNNRGGSTRVKPNKEDKFDLSLYTPID